MFTRKRVLFFRRAGNKRPPPLLPRSQDKYQGVYLPPSTRKYQTPSLCCSSHKISLPVAGGEGVPSPVGAIGCFPHDTIKSGVRHSSPDVKEIYGSLQNIEGRSSPVPGSSGVLRPSPRLPWGYTFPQYNLSQSPGWLRLHSPPSRRPYTFLYFPTIYISFLDIGAYLWVTPFNIIHLIRTDTTQPNTLR